MCATLCNTDTPPLPSTSPPQSPLRYLCLRFSTEPPPCRLLLRAGCKRLPLHRLLIKTPPISSTFHNQPMAAAAPKAALPPLTQAHASSSPHLFQTLARKLQGVSAQALVDKIANDVMGVLRDYPQTVSNHGLCAVAQEFFCVVSCQEELRICIKGMVTTTYNEKQYLTPIKIWLSSRYPQHPPDFYVDLEVAKNMMVPPSHPCIDADGKVRCSPSPSSNRLIPPPVNLTAPRSQVRHPLMPMWAGSHRHGLR